MAAETREALGEAAQRTARGPSWPSSAGVTPDRTKHPRQKLRRIPQAGQSACRIRSAASRSARLRGPRRSVCRKSVRYRRDRHWSDRRPRNDRPRSRRLRLGAAPLRSRGERLPTARLGGCAATKGRRFGSPWPSHPREFGYILHRRSGDSRWRGSRLRNCCKHLGSGVRCGSRSCWIGRRGKTHCSGRVQARRSIIQ